MKSMTICDRCAELHGNEDDEGSGITVHMTRSGARELRDQMLAFWQNLSVGRQAPRGDSPFARLFEALDTKLKEG